MPRLRKPSNSTEKAVQRASGIASISATEDLGSGLTLAAFQALINETQKAINDYNTALSALDPLQNLVDQKERELAELSERMLIGVAAKYGKDSNEYEKAGGTRKSERKRPTRKSPNESAK